MTHSNPSPSGPPEHGNQSGDDSIPDSDADKVSFAPDMTPPTDQGSSQPSSPSEQQPPHSAPPPPPPAMPPPAPAMSKPEPPLGMILGLIVAALGLILLAVGLILPIVEVDTEDLSESGGMFSIYSIPYAASGGFENKSLIILPFLVLAVIAAATRFDRIKWPVRAAAVFLAVLSIAAAYIPMAEASHMVDFLQQDQDEVDISVSVGGGFYFVMFGSIALAASTFLMDLKLQMQPQQNQGPYYGPVTGGGPNQPTVTMQPNQNPPQ